MLAFEPPPPQALPTLEEFEKKLQNRKKEKELAQIAAFNAAGKGEFDASSWGEDREQKQDFFAEDQSLLKEGRSVKYLHSGWVAADCFANGVVAFCLYKQELFMWMWFNIIVFGIGGWLLACRYIEFLKGKFQAKLRHRTHLLLQKILILSLAIAIGGTIKTCYYLIGIEAADWWLLSGCGWVSILYI